MGLYAFENDTTMHAGGSALLWKYKFKVQSRVEWSGIHV